ncbi:MAG TPA: TonB-dependent receptor [Thermoanaerobaculia bacterium]|nr:TonB-dependent receptor [Thermoanaerobaculia bacterium]
MNRLVRLLLATLVLSLPAAAQLPQPGASGVATEVVVTAGAVPEDAVSLGVATTVIDRATIERSRVSTVADLLRTVPGIDVAQSGGPGGVTSLFLRGTNSNSTLVLVDGVKLNSPYFGGVDLSTLGTANVERIEIVRGPFSALYGSEAIGGVVQVITRRASADGLEGQAHFGLGNASAREGGVNAALRSGPIGVTAGFRRGTIAGDLPNEFFEGTDLSAALDVQISPNAKTGVAVKRESSRTGIPFSGTTATPLRATTADTTLVSVPISVVLGARTTLEAAGTFANDAPTYTDPDDPWGFTFSETKARRAGGRVVLSHTSGANRISVGTDYEQTKVDNEDSYGVQLDGLTTSTWSVFAEDRISLADDRLAITAGVRRDENSAFGASTNPRVALSWRVAPAVKLRAAAGSAFRAPSTGELYYPFSGNPGLQPEESVSYEAGAEWVLGRGLVFEASLFRSDVKDLIRYDFATFTNVNVGRARMEGAEATLRGTISASTWASASYTWLDTEDRDTGLPLLRRPKNAAAVTVGGDLGRGATAELTGLYVGERDDVDATTYQRVTNPAYFRVDVAATGPRFFDHVAPFVRVKNVLDRDYDEVAGYPSPGRRFVAGIDLAF